MRALFLIVIFVSITASVLGIEEIPSSSTYFWAASIGLVACGVLMGFDLLFRRFNLRTLNTAIIGLFFGYALFLALNLIFTTLLSLSELDKTLPFVDTARLFLLLFGTYLGLTITLRAAGEIHIHIPFVKLTTMAAPTKPNGKPLMQKGEPLKIKIQRFGKEDLQGVGYLDDGTMVVVNGGRNYMGEIISTRILSVKDTPSGRMIFCNVAESEIGTYVDAF